MTNSNSVDYVFDEPPKNNRGQVSKLTLSGKLLFNIDPSTATSADTDNLSLLITKALSILCNEMKYPCTCLVITDIQKIDGFQFFVSNIIFVHPIDNTKILMRGRIAFNKNNMLGNFVPPIIDEYNKDILKDMIYNNDWMTKESLEEYRKISENNIIAKHKQITDNKLPEKDSSDFSNDFTIY